MKKLTSIFLVLAMLLTLAPMNILAAEDDTTAFSDMKTTDYYAQAAAALEKLGVISGYPDGTYGAEKTITRAEMAVIVCKIIGKDAEAEAAKGETVFDDVASDHWASGYINIAVKEGIISGDGDGNFRPEDEVKYEEAIKMIVCALGYAEEVEFDPSDWSKAYLEIANEKGITADLKGKKGEAATRGDIAVMSYNGLATEGEDSKIPATPTASVSGGEYKTTQSVKLTTATKDADIYYTTDGTEPTEKSTKYTTAISISQTTTLKAIAVKNGVASKNVMSVDYTITKTTSGGGGGGGSISGGSSKIAVVSAELQVNGSAVSSANVGDTLTLVTNPDAATGTILWTIGGTEIANTGDTYTVTTLDMGKTVKAQFTVTGLYNGVVSAECTVAKTTQVTAQDIMTQDADSSPVVLTDAENTVFLDNEGNTVTVDATSTITLSIDNPEQTSEEISNATTAAIQAFANNLGALAESLSDVTAVAVNVAMSVNETEVHPVGDVTVTLSAEQLGLPAGADLSTYTFSANHTNKNGQNEVVDGSVVTIDGVQYVRFEFNGLSTIWIGNIPPRTVSFYNTKADAENKVNSIGTVNVKFGDYTPTLKIPTPSNEGYLFSGWNYDMTRTPIISNLDVYANWVKGEKMPSNSIEAAFDTQTVSGLSIEIADGSVKVSCEEEGTVLPANLILNVFVSAPSDAFKYCQGTNAAEIAAFDDKDVYTPLTTSGKAGFEVAVTDEEGLIVPSSNTFYYKWVDSNYETISLHEITVNIADGSDKAKYMEYTANVNRGIGIFEAYLIDSDDSSKDYVGYINNYLSGKATTGYTLDNNVRFDGNRIDYDYSSYDTVKLVFTPFKGETYSGTDTVAASGYYYTENGNYDWTGSCEIKDGKLVVTYPFNSVIMTNDWATATVTVNGISQEIDIDWDDRVTNINVIENIECETWEQVVNALQGISSDKEYQINCSASDAITLSGSLTIPANVDIYLRNCPTFTVANGAKLVMCDDRNALISSNIGVINGDIIVETGGTVTAAYTGTNNGSRYYPYIRGNKITFRSGSYLTVPAETLISMHGDELIFEAGSTFENNGSFHASNFDYVQLNGTINSTGYSYFYGDEIDIGGKITHNPSGWRAFELYGTVTVQENASVILNNAYNRSNNQLEIYGPLTNKGTIEIKGTNASATIMNNGFANYNMGTISVASGCSVVINGTKYINTGVIGGGGTIKASLGDDYTNYDDGVEYVYVEESEYWDDSLEKNVYKLSNYSRYKYTHDPSKTVDVILYLGEVVNMGSGTCTITVDAEEFPSTVSDN